MSGLGTFLAAAVGPLVKKGLQALGFGVVSYVAMKAALDAALNAAKAAWSGLAGFPEALALIQMAGVNTAASIIAGALVARLALQSLKKLELVK